MDQLRILTFSTLYPDAAQPNHGVFVENRLRHLVGSGAVSARVVAPVPWFPLKDERFGRYAVYARAPHEEVRFGIPVSHPRFPAVPRLGMTVAPGALFAGSLATVRRHLAKSDFHLIDAHYLYPDGVAGMLLGAALQRPVVLTARGTDVSLIPRHLLPRLQIRYAARKAAAVITVSQALKDSLVSLGVDSDHITVLRNGVDLETFAPGDRNSARASLELRGRVLLSVGHLIERKGHDLVISALPHLDDTTLVIVGDGPEHSRLVSLANRLGVADRVRFAGAVPHEKMQTYYTAAEILVLASSREGWPNVLLEAMACGTPVVASAVWGTPEIVSRPEAGVLMTARTPEGVVDAVTKLFRSPPSRQATRQFAEQFSWDATTNGQVELFRRILRGRKERARTTVEC